MTTFLIDLSIIGIVVFCAWRGYKNGLIRGVFGVVALIVSLILANIAASAYSEEFTGILTPFVGGVVDTALADMVEDDDDIEYVIIEREFEGDGYSAAYTALRQIGLPSPAADRIAEMAVEDDSEGFLSDRIADNLSSVLAFVAVFAIAFVLIAIIFAVIGNLIGFVFSLPGLKLVDIIAGSVFGLVKGLLIILTLAVIVRYYGLLALETLEGTSVLNYLVNNNLVADMLGL